MRRRSLVLSTLLAVPFAVLACNGSELSEPAEGTLEVTTQTTGTTVPASYTIQLDERTAQPIGPSATLSFPDVTPGEHRLLLSGLPDHCTVEGENPRTVAVTSGRTVVSEFQVTCTVESGSLLITTVTTGESLDPDGYLLIVSGRPGQRVGINAANVVEDLVPMQYTVTLTEAAPNCTIAQGASRDVNVAPGSQQSVTFEVACTFSGAVRWDTIPLPPGYTAFTPCCNGKSLWGTSPTDLFVLARTGSPGTGAILRYDGRVWTTQLVTPDTLLLGIAGASPTEVFAVGGPLWSGSSEEDVVLRYDGSGWSETPGPVEDSVLVRYYDVWQAASGEAFLGGYRERSSTRSELLARFDGVSWSEMDTPDFGTYPKFTALAGTSGSDVWAIGDREKCEDCSYLVAIVAHWNGTRWILAHSASNYSYNGIFALAPDKVWIAAMDPDFNGAVVHWDGTSWTAQAPLPEPVGGLNDIWGSSPSDLYAAGHGKLFHHDGSAWSEVVGVGGEVVWGTSREDVFVLGSQHVIHGRP